MCLVYIQYALHNAPRTVKTIGAVPESLYSNGEVCGVPISRNTKEEVFLLLKYLQNYSSTHFIRYWFIQTK